MITVRVLGPCYLALKFDLILDINQGPALTLNMQHLLCQVEISGSNTVHAVKSLACLMGNNRLDYNVPVEGMQASHPLYVALLSLLIADNNEERTMYK